MGTGRRPVGGSCGIAAAEGPSFRYSANAARGADSFRLSVTGTSVRIPGNSDIVVDVTVQQFADALYGTWAGVAAGKSGPAAEQRTGICERLSALRRPTRRVRLQVPRSKTASRFRTLL
jgi:hypothetical protein